MKLYLSPKAQYQYQCLKGRSVTYAERYAFMQENIEEYAQQMKRKYMTYDVLYADYQKTTDNPYGYTQFKAIIQEYEKNHDYKYHNVYEPGREMQFDFAGDNLWIVDKSTGEAIQAIVLVCVLPYSMLSYVTALPSAKMEYLFQGKHPINHVY